MSTSPVEPEPRDRHRRRAIATVVVAALLVCCLIVQPWTWLSSAVQGAGDSRQYPHADGALHISLGDDDLETDLLPHYGLTLPCGASDLRYGNLQEPISQLYLKFRAPAGCVDDFRHRHDLTPTRAGERLSGVPDEYDWHICSSAALYSGESSGNHINLVVDGDPTTPTVYLVITRSGPGADQ